jgi:uncharacterized protein YndB with AHSA1/START domain
MNDSRDKGIIISRVFSAPKKLVWEAWTYPELVKKWWGPKDFFAPSIKIDLREGGKYIFAMHGPKDSNWDKDMYSAGVYKKIVPNEKLIVTDYFSDSDGNKLKPTNYEQDPNFPDLSVVTVLFEEVDKNKTKLSIIYSKPETEKESQAMLRSGMKEGWNSSLDKLSEILNNG